MSGLVFSFSLIELVPKLSSWFVFLSELYLDGEDFGAGGSSRSSFF
jgi:hypothetical protein